MSDLFANLSFQALGAAQAAPVVSPALPALFAPGEAGLQNLPAAPGEAGFADEELAADPGASEVENFSSQALIPESGTEAANFGFESTTFSFPSEQDPVEKQDFRAASKKNEGIPHLALEPLGYDLSALSVPPEPGPGDLPAQPIETLKPSESRPPLEFTPAPVKVPRHRPEAERPVGQAFASEPPRQDKVGGPEQVVHSEVIPDLSRSAAPAPAIPTEISTAEPSKSVLPAAARPASRPPEPLFPKNETLERPQTPLVSTPSAVPLRRPVIEPGIKGEAALNPDELLRSSTGAAPAAPGRSQARSAGYAPEQPERSSPDSRIFPAEAQDKTHGTTPQVLATARPAVPAYNKTAQPSLAAAPDSHAAPEIELSPAPSKPPVARDRIQPARMEGGEEPQPLTGPATRPVPAQEEEAPVIRVSIGRVVVRASTPQAQAPTRSVQPAQLTLSLDDYLKNRRRRVQ